MNISIHDQWSKLRKSPSSRVSTIYHSLSFKLLWWRLHCQSSCPTVARTKDLTRPRVFLKWRHSFRILLLRSSEDQYSWSEDTVIFALNTDLIHVTLKIDIEEWFLDILDQFHYFSIPHIWNDVLESWWIFPISHADHTQSNRKICMTSIRIRVPRLHGREILPS